MIIYFSGTGNSQLIALQLAKQLSDELVSIKTLLKSGRKSTLSSSKPIIFVSPIYAWRLPRIVEKWILDTQFNGCSDAYFVLTCGDSVGNAYRYIQRLCSKKDFAFRGLSSLKMPENYLALFPVPSPEQAHEIIERALPSIPGIVEKIKDDLALPRPSISVLGRLQSFLLNPLFYRFWVSDKGFTLSKCCTGCGLCARRCPLNNIAIDSKRPSWGGNCTHCMACICGCPALAIEYKKKTKGKPRHYVMSE